MFEFSNVNLKLQKSALFFHFSHFQTDVKPQRQIR